MPALTQFIASLLGGLVIVLFGPGLAGGAIGAIVGCFGGLVAAALAGGAAGAITARLTEDGSNGRPDKFSVTLMLIGLVAGACGALPGTLAGTQLFAMVNGMGGALVGFIAAAIAGGASGALINCVLFLVAPSAD